MEQIICGTRKQRVSEPRGCTSTNSNSGGRKLCWTLGKALGFRGTDLAVGSNCISRFRSRFWTNYTDPFQGNDVVLGPVPLKMVLTLGGVVPGAERAARCSCVSRCVCRTPLGPRAHPWSSMARLSPRDPPWQMSSSQPAAIALRLMAAVITHTISLFM